MLVVLFGPSGVGKSRLIALLRHRRGLIYVTPETTRPLRDGEQDKVHRSEADFAERAARGEYLWVNELFGVRYGTPAALLAEAIARPEPTHALDMLLVSAATVAAAGGHQTGILILPPSTGTLRERLSAAGRAARTEAAIADLDACLAAALCPPEPIRAVIVNDDLERAYEQLCAAIDATVS